MQIRKILYNFLILYVKKKSAIHIFKTDKILILNSFLITYIELIN